MKDYDRTFCQQERDYVLAYPDANLARTIPGTDEAFTLKKAWRRTNHLRSISPIP